MRVGQLVVDVAPLRASRDFRAVFAARVVSLLSVGLMGATVGMQVFALTGSSLHVGLVSACLAGPMIAGLVAGGVLADRLDRRRMMVATRAAYVVVVLGFLANAAAGRPQLWAIYALATVAGAINGLSAPPLLAAMPALVGREHIVAAGALTAVATQVGAVVGPSLAGTIVGAGGFAICFAVILAGALLVPLLLARVRPLPAAERAGPSASGLHALAEAARFIRGNRLVVGLLLIDVAATVFAMPQALFPELGARRFGGGASVVGLLYAAPGAGALVGALASGWTGRVARPGVALIVAVALWGAAMTAFGLSAHLPVANLPVAIAFLVLAGVGHSASEILRRGLLQTHTPDGMQGRVGSLWMMQAIAGPAIGNVNAGLLARPFGAATAVVVGGVLCLAGTAAVAAAVPALRRAAAMPRRVPNASATTAPALALATPPAPTRS